MILFASKLLPIFFLPLGVTLLLLVAGLALRRRSLLITAASVLWLTSMPLVGNALMRAVEDGQRTQAQDAPVCDAIIVLSTGRVVAPGPAAISEWTDADRFFAGVELFKAGRAPLLVFTGGWSPTQPNAPLEGDFLSRYAAELGVPDASVLTTGRVRNTAEEASAVSAVLRARFPDSARVLLVTSAFHMARAKHLVELTGLAVTPFPVDFAGSTASTVSLLDLLPTADGLGRTQLALRELYGRLYYGVALF